MLKHFLGNSPNWYKLTIIGFLVFNIISYFTLGTTITAWIFIAEFIFTLAMALKCYPLISGGLLAIQILFLLTSSLAPLIDLSYGRMVKMAFPYAIVLGGMGLIGVMYFL